MKLKLIIPILCCYSIICFSCKKNIKEAFIDSEGIMTIPISSIKENIQDTLDFKEPQIVILETNEESILAEISRIFVDEDLLFIFDKALMKIFLFNINGEYTNKIDRKGQGPGEYIQIGDFAIDTDKKQIILLCNVPNKLMFFSYDGEFISEENLHTSYRRLITDNKYFYFEKLLNTDEDKYQLNILEMGTSNKQEALSDLGIENNLYIAGNSLSRGDNLLYVRRFDNSIYEFNDGKIHKEYSLDFKEYSAPDKIKKMKDDIEVYSECGNRKYIYSMTNAVKTDRYIMLKTNLGLLLYDKTKDIMNGYERILNSKFQIPFTDYIPLGNTNKIVCSIDNPSSLKHAVEHAPDKEKNNERYLGLLDIADKLIGEEDNPVLFIYEFKE